MSPDNMRKLQHLINGAISSRAIILAHTQGRYAELGRNPHWVKVSDLLPLLTAEKESAMPLTSSQQSAVRILDSQRVPNAKVIVTSTKKEKL